MKSLTIVLLLISANYVYSQRCKDYHLGANCRPKINEAIGFIPSSQSRSAVLEAHKLYTFNMSLFRNTDYRIIFCCDRNFYPIHFTIFNDESGEVIYDNKNDDYVESIGFSTDNPMNVTVHITLLAEKKEFKDIGQNRTCLGMLVLYKKIPKIGF